MDGQAERAPQRLISLHRDIVAMNERNLATDDRLVDTLTAMHESKGLMQRERDRAAATASREASPRMEPAASEVRAADFAQSRQPVPAAQIQAAESPRQRTPFIRDIPFEFDRGSGRCRPSRRASRRGPCRGTERLAPAKGASHGRNETKRGAGAAQGLAPYGCRCDPAHDQRRLAPDQVRS